MMEGMLTRMGDIITHFPRQRFGQPAQFDPTLLYLVSAASDAVIEKTPRVDDGQSHVGASVSARLLDRCVCTHRISDATSARLPVTAC